MWDKAVTVFRGKVTAQRLTLKRWNWQVNFQINKWTFYHKKLEKGKQNKSKANGWKEVIKNKNQLNWSRLTVEKSQWHQKLVLQNKKKKGIDKTDKSLPRLMKIKGEKSQVTNIRSETGLSLQILQLLKE